MSGPIRSSIGLNIKRLLKYLDSYKHDIPRFSTSLGELENNSLFTCYSDLKRHFTKIEKLVTYLDSLHGSWITFLTSLTNTHDRAQESKIYDDYILNYGDYTATLNTAKDILEQIQTYKDSFRNEIFARKVEENEHDDDQPDQNILSGHSTPMPHSAPALTHSNINPNVATSAHLPPVTIPPFYGDITKWPSFWETFNSMVHSQSMSECIKFYHLKTLIRGEASQLISGLPTDSYNYSIAISLLHDAYGNTDEICHKLRAQIISFSLIGTSASAMLKSYHFLLRTFRQLQNLGDNIDTSTYAQLIESRFPKHLMMKVIPKLTVRPITAQPLLDKIGDILKQESTVERIYADNKRIILPSNKLHYGSSNTVNNNTTHRPDNRYNESLPISSTFSAASNVPKENNLTNKGCAYCLNNSHLSTMCEKYSTPDARKKRSVELKLCFNCLGDHSYKDCKSKKTCRICKKKHHTSLCFTPIVHSSNRQLPPSDSKRRAYGNKGGPSIQLRQQKPSPSVSFTSTVSETPVTSVLEHSDYFTGTTINHIDNSNNISTLPLNDYSFETLLMCAYITVSNPNLIEKSMTVLAFFDSGSNRSYISSDLATKLELSSHNVEKLQINTFANKSPTTLHTLNHSLNIHFNDKTWRTIPVTSLDTMTPRLHFIPISHDNVSYIRTHSTLTLPHSYEKPSILIGSDYMWDILDGYSYTALPSGFLLLDTKIGFMLTGKGRLNYINKNILTTNTAVHDKYNEINSLLENFWKLETIGIHENPTLSDDEECLRIFSSTVSKNNDRYVVKWPWKSSDPRLPINFSLCLSRLHSVFKQLNNNFELMQKYDAIIKEQLTLDIIEPVLNDHKPDSNIIHYLAHHPVVNLQKSTTKVRIVYDASAKTRNNPSLNECLYRGPVLLPDLCGVLLRFRLAPIAISADVEKAFLQITLAPPDREVTRFLWLKDVTKPPTPNNIITYRFTRVPFGIISSPFLLGATIRYHLKQSETTIAHNLWRNLYVDNVFMAAKNVDNAKQLYFESRKLFEDASMNLREFISNNAEFNEFLKEKGHHIPDISKILGIKWNISTDNLHFLIPSFIEKDVTKRNILKYIASIYDPLGFISPLFVLPKVFLQKLWKTSLSWDEKITTELFDEWSNISKYWNNNIISLRRSIKIPDDSNIQLHCFVDASGHTYGAVTYLRINHNNKVTTDILFTKNRLCPIQGMTIPKLELMALLVGSRMVRFLHEQLDITISETYIWSDPSCALHWLNTTKDLPRFISNRVKEILKISDFTSFRHLPSQDNPADIITRGMIPEELVDSKLWWNGPSWLLKSKDLWPDNTTFTIIPEDENSEIDDTLVVNYTHTAIIEDSFQLTNFDPTRYSSFSSMINILCYILFFIFKCTRKKNLFICQTLNKYYDNLPITVNTRKLATLFAFKLSQALHPPLEDDIRQWRLQNDEFGLWRSSSRLDLNNSTYDTKFPVFLHRSCYITHLFIIYIHNNLTHSGVNSTIANLRQLVWIL